MFLLGVLAGHVQTVMSYDHVPHKWKDPKLFEMTKAEVRDYLGTPLPFDPKWEGADRWKLEFGSHRYFLYVDYKRDAANDGLRPPPRRVNHIFLEGQVQACTGNNVYINLPHYRNTSIKKVVAFSLHMIEAISGAYC